MEPRTLEVRVVHRRLEADSIVSFVLMMPDGSRLPAFSPGAHIDVYMPGGEMRQYSLCNSPSDASRYEIAVLLDPASRGGSAHMHRDVLEGTLIRIGVPRNHFELVEKTGRPLLLAAGIGVTPLLCMARHLAQADADFEMHYFARSPAKAAFIERIRASRFARNVSLHFDDGPLEQRIALSEVLADPEVGRRAYVCGPRGFLQAALAAANSSHWPADRVHFEAFKPEPAAERAGGAFEVQIASTGAVYEVPADRTVAQILLEQSLPVSLSCEQGICGACITRVVSGLPDHRDFILSAEERARNDQFTPCCSRSLSPRLVLDL